MKQLQGRRALVTGAADGIGRGIAECFIDQGAEVLAVDLDAEKLAEGFDGRAGVTPLQVDVSADDAPKVLVEACVMSLEVSIFWSTTPAFPANLRCLKIVRTRIGEGCSL
ncbi:hypothetical protein VM77_00320 [Citromicrobium sp. JL31]|nr:hypothetical protein WG74_11915 [Citromicrobium sp. JL477]KPM14409.1 hypothetical protein VO58_11435 [Citromicrobium sp. JL1351]KPM20889.1 hypothetical protein VM77_00320 [Citromicrobium sp. JL31]KPM26874.1 hypothetical protein VO57_06335 [Citromicrobium sp. JL2201]